MDSAFPGWLNPFQAIQREKKLLLACTAVIALALNIYWIGIRYYPYQYIYYNSLVKGLAGAEKVFGIDEATDYWSVSYRQGMNWLNNNTTGDISLYVPYCDWLVRLPRHIWLRPGINIIDEEKAVKLLNEKTPFYVFLVNEPRYSRKIANYSAENVKPVYEVIVDKVPILFIYKVTG